MIRLFQKLYLRHRFWFILLILSLFFSNLVEGIGISLVVPLLQQVVNGAQGTDSISLAIKGIFQFIGIQQDLVTVMVFLCLAFFVKTAFALWAKQISVKVSAQFMADTQRQLYSGLLAAGLGFFTSEKQGRLINAVTSESVRSANAFVLFSQWISGWLTIALYIVLAIKVSGGLAIMAALVGMLAVAPLKLITRRALEYGKVWTGLNEGMQNFLGETISGVKFIKGTGSENRMSSVFSEMTQSYADNWQKVAFNSNLTAIAAQPVAVFVLCLILYTGLRMNLAFSELLVFLLLFQRLLPTISNTQNTLNEMNANLPAYQRIDEIQMLADKMREGNQGKVTQDFSGKIELQNLSFRYLPEGDSWVLRDISISIPFGQTIALVGPSGGGKTTLVDILMGFYRPQTGKVLVSGESLENLNLNQWRHQISYVSQDTVLFHDSIKKNIQWDQDSASDEEVVAAAKLANAHEFILSSEKGYDTIVGDKGARLSGGQRQRLALARAILRKPKVLILDEATSALDSESEQLIKQTLHKLKQSHSMTIVMIAHRMATITEADLVYVIQQGKIVESGTFSELRGHGEGFLAKM